MELRRLRLLHELSRLGTVAAVADALSYSPSSVSVQLAQLEREAGAKLLRRVGRNVELTAAGRRLAAYAAGALAADEAIRTELAAAGDAPRGRLRLTIVQSTALAFLPGVLERLAESAPDLAVEVTQRETVPALEELRSRAVDLVVGIEYDPVPVPRQRDIDRRDLLREDVLVVQHAGVPKRRAVRIAALEDVAWASGHRGTGLDAVVRNVCNRLGGFEPDVRHRSDDAFVLSAVVASGRAVTLLPALFTTTAPQITAHRLRDERLQRTIFTAARATTVDAQAVVAVRHALYETARKVASRQRNIEVSARPSP
jgi:DNA-binding transcriptional LysR family regulator